VRGAKVVGVVATTEEEGAAAIFGACVVLIGKNSGLYQEAFASHRHDRTWTDNGVCSQIERHWRCLMLVFLQWTVPNVAWVFGLCYAVRVASKHS